MHDLLQLLENTLVWKLLVGYWVFSAFVGALPTPQQNSNVAYQTIFRFFHILAGNVNRAAVTFKVPGSDQQSVQDK